MNHNKKHHVSGTSGFFIVTVVIFMCIWGMLLFFFHYAGIFGTDRMKGNDTLLSVLEISYQVIFLTTSLLSLLSDKSETVYWERFTEYVMVTPKYFNFIGLSLLGFFSLFIQTVCLALSYITAFYISFALGIVIIIFLWWKMSSIFFRRDYYKRKLSMQDFTKEKTDLLREFTFAAIENHNYRTVNENLDLLIFRISKDDGITADLKEYAKKTLFLILDYLDSHNQAEWIGGFIENNAALIRKNNDLCFDIMSWIIRDPERKGIWTCFVSCILEKDDSFDCFLGKKFKSFTDRYPLPFTKGNEMSDKFMAFQFDTSEKMEKANAICEEYEIFIRDYSLFVYENDLTKEQESFLALVLKNPDIYKACPKCCNIIDFYGQSDSVDLVIDTIGSSDRRFSSFIRSFINVAYTFNYHAAIEDKRDIECVAEKIMNAYDQKKYHDSKLSFIYDIFMTNYLDFYSKTKIKYMEKLFRAGDFEKLGEVIYHDSDTCSRISESECSDIMLRVLIFIKDNLLTFIVPGKNIEERKEGGVTKYDIRLDKDNILEDVNPRQIKTERMPDHDEVIGIIDFITNLRIALTEVKDSELTEKTDKYISALRDFPVIRKSK